MASSKKKNITVEEGEGWLVSYADMMTLIACFFILMMAFANYDPVGFDKKANELSKSFNQGKYKPSENKLSELSEEIAMHPDILKKSKISVIDSETVITFSGSVLFKPGTYEIHPEVLPTLDSLIDIIRTKDPNYKIIIEGHTDPIEHKSNPKIDSSWDLSALRSSKILQRFEYFGFNPQTLLSVAKGDSTPVSDNFDARGTPLPENMLANRRVVIKVIEPKDKKKKVKMGIGVYFND